MNSYLGLSGILVEVDSAIRAYTQGTYQALSSALYPTLQLVMVLYIVFYGIGHLTGRAALDFWQTVRHLMLMVIVSAFVTRWDFFALFFGNVFTEGPGRLMTMVGGGSDPYTLLGDVMDRGIMSANAINQNAGIMTLGFLLVGYSVLYMTLLSVGYALYLLVLAKIALGVLLGLAPFFFLFLFFDTTREYFFQYLRQVVNFALIPIFTAAVLGIMLKIPQEALMRLQTVLATHSGHGGRELFFVLLSFLIILFLLHQVTGIAAGIAGGGLHLNPGSFAAGAAAIGLYTSKFAGEKVSEKVSQAGQKWSLWRKRNRS